MALGPFLAMVLRLLPDVLFLFTRRAKQQDKEQIHESEQEFRSALEHAPADGGGDLDDAGDLLERRLREARRVPEQRP